MGIIQPQFSMQIINSYSQVTKFLAKKKKAILLPATLHDMYWFSKKDPAYGAVTHITPDGMPLVFLQRLLGKKVERVYGPTLFASSIESDSSGKFKKHCFIGSRETLHILKKKVLRKLSSESCLFIPIGYSEDISKLITKRAQVALEIFQPDLIWVGIGSPKQVQLAGELSFLPQLKISKIICVGAAFDFYTGVKRQAPTWIAKLGFEWLFRLIQEPRRLWKRYLWYSVKGGFHMITLFRKEISFSVLLKSFILLLLSSFKKLLLKLKKQVFDFFQFYNANLITVLPLAFMVGYFLVLQSQILPTRHVDPDFFQFLGDVPYYMNFQVPPVIHPLPANPILLGIFSSIFTQISMIEIGLYINAISIVFSAFIMYLILKKETNKYIATVASIFFLINPVIFGTATTTNSEGLFTLFLSVVFFLFWKKWTRLASIVIFLGIFIRYEAILLYIAVLGIRLIQKEKLTKILKSGLLFSIPTVCVLLLLLTRNVETSAVSSPYVAEVFERSGDIPELRYFSSFFATLYYDRNVLHSDHTLLSLLTGILFWCFLLILAWKSRKHVNTLSVFSLLFCVLYLLFHTFFPAYLERYFVPGIFACTISFFLNLKGLNKLPNIIIVCLVGIVIFKNASALFPNFTFNPEHIIYSADFFSAQTIIERLPTAQRYTIVTPYPLTIAYYYTGATNFEIVSVLDIKRKTNCKDIQCAVAEYYRLTNKKLIFMYTSLFDWGVHGEYDNSLRSVYNAIGFYEYVEYIESDTLCFIFKADWYGKFQWVEVYTYCGG